MDSLLDEYEENIHKSMTIALRPQSRQPSIVSAHHKRLPATHYNRSHYNNQGNLNDDGVAQYYPTETRLNNSLKVIMAIIGAEDLQK